MNAKLDLILLKLEGIDTTLETLKSDITTLKSDVATLKSDVEVHARLEAMAMDMNRTLGELRSFKQETNAQLDFIAGKLGVHDRDIHLLKLAKA